MSMDKIEKISKITKKASASEGITGVDEPQERMAPNKERFDSLMNAQKTDKVAETQKIEDSSKSSLMDELRNLNQQVNRVSKVSPKELVAQAENAVSKINEVKDKLANPNLNLTNGDQTLIQNKLSHIDENLRVALSKAGLEYSPAIDNLENKPANPIERFLGFLTNGQAQLASLSHEIERMHLNSKEISPVNMLRIQMKVGYITQEVEFFSAVLNKALDSIKTTMNVQV